MIVGKGQEEIMALLTDGRFSGGVYGLGVGHISPVKIRIGPIAYLRTEDIVTVDNKIPKKFPWPYPKKNLKRTRQTTPCHHFTAVVSSVNAHIVSSMIHGAVWDFWNMDKSGKK